MQFFQFYFQNCKKFKKIKNIGIDCTQGHKVFCIKPLHVYINIYIIYVKTKDTSNKTFCSFIIQKHVHYNISVICTSSVFIYRFYSFSI